MSEEDLCDKPWWCPTFYYNWINRCHHVHTRKENGGIDDCKRKECSRCDYERNYYRRWICLDCGAWGWYSR